MQLKKLYIEDYKILKNFSIEFPYDFQNIFPFLLAQDGVFYPRIAYRKGRQSAVSATARKLAVIIWTMITKKVPYKPPTQYLFLDQKRKLKMVSRIKRNIAKFDINPEEPGIVIY